MAKNKACTDGAVGENTQPTNHNTSESENTRNLIMINDNDHDDIQRNDSTMNNDYDNDLNDLVYVNDSIMINDYNTDNINDNMLNVSARKVSINDVNSDANFDANLNCNVSNASAKKVSKIGVNFDANFEANLNASFDANLDANLDSSAAHLANLLNTGCQSPQRTRPSELCL